MTFHVSKHYSVFRVAKAAALRDWKVRFCNIPVDDNTKSNAFQETLSMFTLDEHPVEMDQVSFAERVYLDYLKQLEDSPYKADELGDRISQLRARWIEEQISQGVSDGWITIINKKWDDLIRDHTIINVDSLLTGAWISRNSAVYVEMRLVRRSIYLLSGARKLLSDS